jgi:hypothetical protein
MTAIFSESESIELATEVEAQLRELQNIHANLKNVEPEDRDAAMAKQNNTIAELTKESPQSFLVRFGKAAKGDLCDDDGMLHQQWKKWGDLDNKDALERLGGVLMAMGFSGGALRSLTVVVVVIVVHIGIKAFCEDYGKGSEK